ncbi:hypothetical protein ACVGWW_01265, partial [Enterobacter hormaechei]
PPPPHFLHPEEGKTFFFIVVVWWFFFIRDRRLGGKTPLGSSNKIRMTISGCFLPGYEWR